MTDVAALASSAGSGIAMAIGGIAAVLVLSAVFYLIGRGEDRDRAASAPPRAAESGEKPPASTEPEAPATAEAAEVAEAAKPAEAPAVAARRPRAPRTPRRRPRR